MIADDTPDEGSFLFDDDLRTRLRTNLARHERFATHIDGHRRAAVAVVVVDSDPVVHGVDPNPAPPERMSRIPGAAGYPLTGSVAGTAGGPAILLTRRAATLTRPQRAVGLAGRAGGRGGGPRGQRPFVS